MAEAMEREQQVQQGQEAEEVAGPYPIEMLQVHGKHALIKAELGTQRATNTHLSGMLCFSVLTSLATPLLPHYRRWA